VKVTVQTVPPLDDERAMFGATVVPLMPVGVKFDVVRPDAESKEETTLSTIECCLLASVLSTYAFVVVKRERELARMGEGATSR
jgi:hypothetical protein